MNNQSISNSSSIFPPEVLLQHESIFVNTSINYATVALILYEHLARFPAELAYFWRRKITMSSVLFFSNRYLVLFYSLALLRGAALFTKLASPSLSSLRTNADAEFQSCLQWSNGVRALEILSYVPWAAFLGLRAYALDLHGDARGWPLGTFVFLLSIVPVCINFVDFRWASLVMDPLWGCTEAILERPELSIRAFTQPLPTVTIISRASLVLADLTVIIRTWTSLFPHAAVGPGLRGTLSAVLLRDGTIYFVILALLNLLHLAFCASLIFQSAAHSDVSDVVAVIEPLTSILVTRFMLSLQRAFFRPYVHTDSVRANTNTNATSLHFEAGVIGSIAVVSPPPFPSHEDEDEDEDGDWESGEWYADADEEAPPAYGYGSSGWPGEDPFRDAEVRPQAAASLESQPSL